MKSLKDFYKGKNVLVTGGAGFIGSYLAERLIQYEAKVTILDNFSIGNLNKLYNVISQINLIYGDITNSFSCRKATYNKDIVFHLRVKRPDRRILIQFKDDKNRVIFKRKRRYVIPSEMIELKLNLNELQINPDCESLEIEVIPRPEVLIEED